MSALYTAYNFDLCTIDTYNSEKAVSSNKKKKFFFHSSLLFIKDQRKKVIKDDSLVYIYLVSMKVSM